MKFLKNVSALLENTNNESDDVAMTAVKAAVKGANVNCDIKVLSSDDVKKIADIIRKDDSNKMKEKDARCVTEMGIHDTPIIAAYSRDSKLPSIEKNVPVLIATKCMRGRNVMDFCVLAPWFIARENDASVRNAELCLRIAMKMNERK